MKIHIANILPAFAVWFYLVELNIATSHAESEKYHIHDPETPITMFLNDDQFHVTNETYRYKNNPYRLFNQVRWNSDPFHDPKYQIVIGGNKHFRFEEDDQGRILDVERIPENKRPGNDTRIKTYVATVLGKQFLLHTELGNIVGASAPRLTNQIPVPQVGPGYPPPLTSRLPALSIAKGQRSRIEPRP